MERLERSAREIKIDALPEFDELSSIHRELIRRNQLHEDLIYLQVSRGNDGDRDYAFPKNITPTIFLFTQSKPGFISTRRIDRGLRIILLPDYRWARKDIKLTQLLYPVLAKNHAQEVGYDDAWFMQDGLVTEGTTNNAGIIVSDRFITHSVDQDILAGTARVTLIEAASFLGLKVEERSIMLDEIDQAEEAFVTSSMNIIVPFTQIDGALI